MNISICIPCVDKHIPLLCNFLKTITFFTRKPDEIIISLSPKFDKLDLNNIKNTLEKNYLCYNLKCLVQNNEHHQAIEFFYKAVSGIPEDIEVLSQLGASLRRISQFDASIKMYEKILEIQPKNVDAYVHMSASLGNPPKKWLC